MSVVVFSSFPSRSIQHGRGKIDYCILTFPYRWIYQTALNSWTQHEFSDAIDGNPFLVCVYSPRVVVCCTLSVFLLSIVRRARRLEGPSPSNPVPLVWFCTCFNYIVCALYFIFSLKLILHISVHKGPETGKT